MKGQSEIKIDLKKDKGKALCLARGIIDVTHKPGQ